MFHDLRPAGRAATTRPTSTQRLGAPRAGLHPHRVLCPPLARLLDVRCEHRPAQLRPHRGQAARPAARRRARCASSTTPTPSTRASLAAVPRRTGADAMLLRGTEGEPVADPRRLPRIDVFVGRPAHRRARACPRRTACCASCRVLPRSDRCGHHRALHPVACVSGAKPARRRWSSRCEAMPAHAGRRGLARPVGADRMTAPTHGARPSCAGRRRPRRPRTADAQGRARAAPRHGAAGRRPGRPTACCATLARSARIVHVGKRGGCAATPQAFIEQLMIAEARRGERVVRLKGGDPFVFGRGGEEARALRAAGIEVEVVNGITAGLAAPAAVGIPVDAPRHSARASCSSPAMAAGRADGHEPDWHALRAQRPDAGDLHGRGAPCGPGGGPAARRACAEHTRGRRQCGLHSRGSASAVDAGRARPGDAELPSLASPAIFVIGDVVRAAPMWAAASIPARQQRG